MPAYAPKNNDDSLGQTSLFEPEQTFDKIQVGLGYLAFQPHYALAFLGFLSKDVTLKRFLEGNLPRAGHFEPLLGTGIRSNLWHL